MAADWACQTLVLQSRHRATDILYGLVKVLFETESFCRILNRLLRREATVLKKQTNCPVYHATEQPAESAPARLWIGGVDHFL
jgi:hypothetical protein